MHQGGGRCRVWTAGLWVAAFVLGAAASTQAAPLYFSGTLSGADPTFNRTLVDGTALSGSATSVYYDVQPFFVGADGLFTFETVAPNPGHYDTLIFLYQHAFNPAAPLGNYVAGNDFYVTGGVFSVLPGPFAVPTSSTGNTGSAPASRLSNIALLAGVQYFAVNTAWNNGEVGTYYSGIGGLTQAGAPIDVTAGNLTPVPEPGSLALLSLGLGALYRRRRTRPA